MVLMPFCIPQGWHGVLDTPLGTYDHVHVHGHFNVHDHYPDHGYFHNHGHDQAH